MQVAEAVGQSLGPGEGPEVSRIAERVMNVQVARDARQRLGFAEKISALRLAKQSGMGKIETASHVRMIDGFNLAGQPGWQ